MAIEYTIDFRNDYKNTILKYFEENEISTSDISKSDTMSISLKFHKHQKELLSENTLEQNTSLDIKYSSDMMFKWLNYLEEQIEDSINEIVELAKQSNIKVTKFPLHIELQLDIETKSFEIYETNNGFNINLEK